MSVKSVPGCLVLIAPRTIGVPEAATPGLGPQLDVSEAPPELEPLEVDVVAAAVLLLLAEAPGAALVVLLLLPQPVSATTPAITARAKPSRTRIQDLLRSTGVLGIPRNDGQTTGSPALVSRSCTRLLAISQPIANTGRSGRGQSASASAPGRTLLWSARGISGRDVHGSRARAAPSLLHQSRSARVRTGQPPRDRQGGAVRPLLALSRDAAPAVPRRVRRRRS